MTASGTKQTCRPVRLMSAFGGRPDMPFKRANFRLWTHFGHGHSRTSAHISALYQFDFPELRQTHALIGLPAAMSKMVADCEVLYIPVFLAQAKMAEGFLP
jgi:hypothetical protein